MNIDRCRKLRMAAFVVLFLIGMAVAEPFDISRSSIDGGGAMHSAGGGFVLSGTIGQPDAGAVSGGDFTLTGGFWFAVVPGDMDEDGGITLGDFELFTGCVSGEQSDIPRPECGSFDFDGDDDVDLRDFSEFQSRFDG